MKLKLMSFILACLYGTSLVAHVQLSVQDQALVDAIKEINFEKVKEAVEKGASADVAINENGDTPLTLVLRDSEELTKIDAEHKNHAIAPILGAVPFLLAVYASQEIKNTHLHKIMHYGGGSIAIVLILASLPGIFNYNYTHLNTEVKLAKLYKILLYLIKHSPTDVKVKICDAILE